MSIDNVSVFVLVAAVFALGGFVKGVIGPDVQMFADDGVTYRPNPANTHKDSVSVGIAFTAVDAKF